MSEWRGEWREVTIAYEVGDRDVEVTEDAMIDAAVGVLGCVCDDDTEVCAAGNWVASGRPAEDDDDE